MSNQNIPIYAALDDTPIMPPLGGGCGGRCKCAPKSGNPLDEIQTMMRAHGLGGDVVANVRLLLLSFEAHRTSDEGKALIEDVRMANAK